MSVNLTKESDAPNVPLPAPVYFGLLLIAGYGLSLVQPFSYPVGALSHYSGWLLHGMASLLLAWCFTLFIRNRTTIMPKNPVNHLVIRGPYRLSRNPMYVSLGLFHLGILLNTGNLWHLVSFLPDMLAIRYWVIAPEEAYMRDRFGSEYLEYCAKVRRWL